MGKATKATKKFAQKHLANVIQSRKDNKEAKELYKRKENKEKKRKRNGTRMKQIRKIMLFVRASDRKPISWPGV